MIFFFFFLIFLKIKKKKRMILRSKSDMFANKLRQLDIIYKWISIILFLKLFWFIQDFYFNFQKKKKNNYWHLKQHRERRLLNWNYPIKETSKYLFPGKIQIQGLQVRITAFFTKLKPFACWQKIAKPPKFAESILSFLFYYIIIF